MYESYSSLQLGGSPFRFLSRRVMYFRQTDSYRTSYNLTQPRQSGQEEGALDEEPITEVKSPFLLVLPPLSPHAEDLGPGDNDAIGAITV